MVSPREIEIICGKETCAFRVHDRYFIEKKRFRAGECPRCGSRTTVVWAHTLVEVPGAVMVLDPSRGDYGRVYVPDSIA